MGFGACPQTPYPGFTVSPTRNDPIPWDPRSRIWGPRPQIRGLGDGPQIGGPKPHSYIGVPDGRQCDLGPYTPPKGGPKQPIWRVVWDPIWLGNMLDFKPVNVNSPIYAVPGVAQIPLFWGPIRDPFWPGPAQNRPRFMVPQAGLAHMTSRDLLKRGSKTGPPEGLF